jgi:hypothetical protein
MRYPDVTLRLARSGGGVGGEVGGFVMRASTVRPVARRNRVSSELHGIELAAVTVLPLTAAGPRREGLLQVKGAGAGWRAA